MDFKSFPSCHGCLDLADVFKFSVNSSDLVSDHDFT